MKQTRFFIILFAAMLSMETWADEWQDPATKVIYSYNADESVAMVSNGKNASGDVEILPSFIVDGKEYKVTSIGDYAFSWNSSITHVIIPTGIELINERAFCFCSSLTSIDLPSSLTCIGPYSFMHCVGLTSVVIPEGVTTIGKDAFSGCSGLLSVTISSGVTSIGDYAFYNTSLTSIIFPKNLKSIGKSSFSHVPLTSITIPSSVTSIGNEAFFDCGSLNSITVEEGNKTYDSRGNCNALIRTSSNTLLLGCSSTVIPDGVTSIVEYAFKVCSGLTSIHIPKSVTSIQYSSFVGCIDLSCISVAEDNPKYDSRDNCNGIIETASDKFLLGCKNSVIPKDVKSIGEQAFFFCRGLTSIILPEGVTSVGQDAFNCCIELETITIPRSLKTFNYASFYDCSGLKAVHISDLSAWCKINFLIIAVILLHLLITCS